MPSRRAAKVTRKRVHAWRLAVLLALGLAGTATFAEKADRDKPVNLEADRVNIDDAKKISTFEGNVVLTQGTLVIRGDRMVVKQDAQGFQFGTAWGNLASFRQKREGYDEFVEGYGERIEYDGKADKVQLFTRASMKRGNDDVRGNYISYDANTEFFQVLGGAKPTAGNTSAGRVYAVIQPKPKASSPPGEKQAVPLKPAESIATPRE